MNSYRSYRWYSVAIACFVIIFAASSVWCQEGFDPDSINLVERAKDDYNPFRTLYSMNSWTFPVFDHNGQPHPDGHILQIIADGGNGVQDPPNADGSPGGDDSLAVGNFNIQFINGEKHIPDGMEPGMFMGMMYFVPYNDNQSIYLRLWEASDPADADYYQDTEEYTTWRGNSGGVIISLQREQIDDIIWKFGLSKKVDRRK